MRRLRETSGSYRRKRAPCFLRSDSNAPEFLASGGSPAARDRAARRRSRSRPPWAASRIGRQTSSRKALKPHCVSQNGRPVATRTIKLKTRPALFAPPRLVVADQAPVQGARTEGDIHLAGRDRLDQLRRFIDGRRQVGVGKQSDRSGRRQQTLPHCGALAAIRASARSDASRSGRGRQKPRARSRRWRRSIHRSTTISSLSGLVRLQITQGVARSFARCDPPR